MLIAITARYAGQSFGVNVGWPCLRPDAAHSISGIVTASAHIAMIRFVGPRNSTVCWAKPPVFLILFEPKRASCRAVTPNLAK
jgi:hypothetical protein